MKKRRLDKILEIPEEVYTNVPKTTITGFSEIILENYNYFSSFSIYLNSSNSLN